MDMGFSREACILALTRTNGIEAATDYLLLHPDPPPPPAAPPAAAAAEAAAPSAVASAMSSVFDMDIGDEEQMMRAIAISLGQSYAAMTGQPPTATDPQVRTITPGQHAGTTACKLNEVSV